MGLPHMLQDHARYFAGLATPNCQDWTSQHNISLDLHLRPGLCSIAMGRDVPTPGSLAMNSSNPTRQKRGSRHLQLDSRVPIPSPRSLSALIEGCRRAAMFCVVKRRQPMLGIEQALAASFGTLYSNFTIYAPLQ